MSKNTTPSSEKNKQNVSFGRRGRFNGVVEKPKDLKKTIKKILKYINFSKLLLIATFIFIVLTTGSTLLSSIIREKIINALWSITEGVSDGLTIAFKWLVVLAIVYGTSCIADYFVTRLSAKLSQKTVFKMRTDLFNKFVKLPIKFLDNHSHGDLMSRMTNDVDSVSNAISQTLSSLISGALMIVGNLVIMICYSWLMTIIVVLSVFLTLFATKVLTKHMGKYFTKQSSILGALNGRAEEAITGYHTIVAYNKEKDIKDEFDSISDDFAKTSIKAQIWGGSMGPVMNFIHNLTYVIIAVVGAWIVISKPDKLLMDVGTISLFLTCARQFSRPFSQIANLYGQILTASAGAERIFEIMDSDSENDNGTVHIDESGFEGNITFKNVDFSYVEGEKVLKNFSLDVRKGQKIALVGATGSGKTTIVNLLMGFYDIDSGEICIDGININDIPKKDLRSAIAIVLQDTVLFKDTIEANIKYGNDAATFEEMKAASILSNANYFVKKLPDKYQTVLAEGGSNLSQGQRQLLTIARAVLANPKILILDEATSSVDTRTEKNIQDAMVNLMANRTSLIIAHRLSTIQDADIIVVIDKGEIKEMGNHNDLLSKKGKYYDLYMTQFAGKQI